MISGSPAESPLLIVEDDDDVREALVDLVRRWGFPVEGVADAEAGMRRLQAGQRFALLITDQRLPGALNGLDMIREMRAAYADAPPAVIITGEVDSPLLSAAALDGVAVLHKPVRSAQLQRLLGVRPQLPD